MKPRTRRVPFLVAISVFLSAAFLLINFNGHVSRAQGSVSVSAADPASTAQGTVNLTVKVTGKGFKSGAKAQWFVTSTTDPGGVTVNSTAFVSSAEVDANITVADTATIANFDIAVTNPDGRGGKGTELFAVTAKKTAVVCPAPEPTPTSDTKCYAAMPGCLDSTFGGVGFVRTSPGGISFSNEGLAVQPDGKIVLGGSARTAPSASIPINFFVVRYNPDGSLDTSFGDPDPLNPPLRLGYTLTSFGTAGDYARSIVLQPDGKIVLAGNGGGNMEIARYNPDGTLDSSFGSAGKVTVVMDKRSQSDAYSVALQSDGKIVAGGGACGTGSSPCGFALARLNTNGTLDSTFGTGGKLITSPGVGFGGGTNGIAIQRIPAITGEERIVIGGFAGYSTSSGTTHIWELMRFRANGAVDTSFGVNGTVTTTFYGYRDELRGVGIDSNNRIVGTGLTYTADPSCSGVIDAAVVRYTQDGALDASFGGGKQIVDVAGGRNNVSGLVMQADGKIVITETAANYFGVLRFNVDGTRDFSFGPLAAGWVTTDLYGFGSFASGGAAIQPSDGKIVVAGAAYLALNSQGNFAVARYIP